MTARARLHGDGEGWDTAPAGYDAALPHAYSIGMPGTAERGDNAELVPALRQRAKEVWHRMAADGVASH